MLDNKPKNPNEFLEPDKNFLSINLHEKCPLSMKTSINSSVKLALKRYIKLGIDQQLASEI